MEKYKVIFEQTETFYVVVEANGKDDASDKASQEFSNGNYTDMGNCSVEEVANEKIQ